MITFQTERVAVDKVMSGSCWRVGVRSAELAALSDNAAFCTWQSANYKLDSSHAIKLLRLKRTNWQLQVLFPNHVYAFTTSAICKQYM
jgi:hypothetical protein